MLCLPLEFSVEERSFADPSPVFSCEASKAAWKEAGFWDVNSILHGGVARAPPLIVSSTSSFLLEINSVLGGASSAVDSPSFSRDASIRAGADRDDAGRVVADFSKQLSRSFSVEDGELLAIREGP
ncbi:hypothetical protein PanWU01x14_318040 [Parasponia andersonii]|uniref:Uncharacterized protein n=1 Tax=Parasponia andersonii TaxID=3476 RepID=A0A2P5AMD6_PARAD|nr:hypothetical protein PanWU01x14_318040 [Parasponia andersonii]